MLASVLAEPAPTRRRLRAWRAIRGAGLLGASWAALLSACGHLPAVAGCFLVIACAAASLACALSLRRWAL